ncbi:MAG: GNAT family N-acetyltransferase [Clostridiales bacterium]|jgi:phosphinothricin acetyltransferase|nr:GNAT family N-acetyltransferase [Clostridiales bacterium]
MIRLATLADSKPLNEIYSYYVCNTPFTFECVPPTSDEFSVRICEALEYFPFYVYEDGGEILGYAYAHKYHEREAYRWICETSIYIRANLQRKGVGAALYEKVLKSVKDQGFSKALAILGCPNEPSEAFHLKMGFTLMAVFPRMGFKLDGWHDVAYYVMELNQAKDKMSEPVPYWMIADEED